MFRKKGECVCCVLACVENARDKELLESDGVQVGFHTFLVYNNNCVYWACCRSEESDVDVIIKLLVGWYQFNLIGVDLNYRG